jgi:hypothetical protein
MAFVRAILLLVAFFFSMKIVAQQKQPQKPDNSVLKAYKPEILTSGFIDIVNNGQVNASARFIRLMIGETDKFVLLVPPEKNV